MKITIKEPNENEIYDRSFYMVNGYKLFNKSLSNNDYYEIFTGVFNVELEESDYLKILSLNNKINYNRILDIKTTMYEKRSIPTRRIYTSFVSENEYIFNNTILSKHELKEKVDNKNLVLIKDKYSYYDFTKFDLIETPEKFELTPFRAFEYDENLRDNMITYIRNNISDEFILNEIDNYINNKHLELSKSK